MNDYTSSPRGNEGMFAFMMGAIVGAAAALLFAPASGEETRKRLADTGRRLKDQGQDLAEKARTKFDEMRHHETTGSRGAQGMGGGAGMGPGA